jgi:hypothetical protein
VSKPSLAPHAVTPEEAADRIALRHLADAYCHAADRRDYALMLSLYHDDAYDNHAPFFQGTAKEYVAWLPGMLGHWSATSHSISNALYIIDGDHAEGELLTRAYHRTADHSREIIGYGRYVDRYEKREGIWKFSYRSLVMDYDEVRVIEKSDAAPDAGAGDASIGSAGADDPVYKFLPRFAASRGLPEAK